MEKEECGMEEEIGMLLHIPYFILHTTYFLLSTPFNRGEHLDYKIIP
ncbi:MAG: hypothetical protein QME42_04290 [bacterium]|nr:hypothetical protein [bacterium]